MHIAVLTIYYKHQGIDVMGIVLDLIPIRMQNNIWKYALLHTGTSLSL